MSCDLNASHAHHTCPCTFREAYKMVSSLLTPFLFPPPHTCNFGCPKGVLYLKLCQFSSSCAFFYHLASNISEYYHFIKEMAWVICRNLNVCLYLYLYAFISQNMPNNIKIGWEMGEI